MRHFYNFVDKNITKYVKIIYNKYRFVLEFHLILHNKKFSVKKK